jgi:hypothetical protein
MKTPSAWLALVLLSAFLSAPAFAQEDGVGVGPRGASVFLEASAASVGQGYGVLWGGSGGGYFQGRVLGFMARATALPGNANDRVYNAVIGPRLAVSLPIVRLFVEAGGGMGHSGYYNSQGAYGTSWGAAWQVDAGVSHGILPRVDWRILEIGYGHVYVGSGVSPVMASTGLTVHLW